MTTAADIDALSSVRKFLERSVVVSKEDETADRSEELVALLETVALSFLLYPQMALSAVLQARNLLLQVVTTERQMVEFIQGTLADLNNPDDAVSDTSYLVDAQTALVEIGKLGTLQSGTQAYDRYLTSIQKFLDKQLSSTLKRHGRGEFERSGMEAREDLYSSYSSLVSLHGSMTGRLHDLAVSMSGFQGVDLTRSVSTRTVDLVRQSLDKVQQQISFLSKTVTAIELLSGASALQSISGKRSAYDPVVDTGTLPLGRVISVTSEVVPARLLTNEGPWDVTSLILPYELSITIDEGTPVVIPIPEKSFLMAAYPAPAHFSIPAGHKLYLHYVESGVPAVLSITLTSGSRTPAQVATEITTALGMHGNCSAVGTLLITSATVSSMTVLGYGEGSYSGGYVPPDPSLHAVLGFTEGQVSVSMEQLTSTGLAALLEPYITTLLQDTRVQLSSLVTGAASSLTAEGNVAGLLGIQKTIEAEPSYLLLVEGGATIDPASVGVYSGSKVTVRGDRGLSSLISASTDSKLFFSAPLPRGEGFSVTVIPVLVVVVKDLLSKVGPYDGSFDEDLFKLQGVLTPLLGRPTMAQINDARRVLENLLTRLSALENLLSQYVVPDSSQQFLPVLKKLISGLEERNLDRAIELLKRARFSEFFGLTRDNASKGSRFMSAMEDVGKNELWTTTRQNEMQESQDVAVTPDDHVLAEYEANA